MAIVRIEAICYGVQDLQTATRFFCDVGLEIVHSDSDHTVLRTAVNQTITLRRHDDPRLPLAPGPPCGIREITWGVDDCEELQGIYRELTTDRDAKFDEHGTLHSHDETGYAVAFQVVVAEAPLPVTHEINDCTAFARINRPKQAYGHARPLAIAHIALDIPAADHALANDFYLQRLRFKAVDAVPAVGIFMQCEGDLQHHNLLLCHRSDCLGVNHVAFEVRDHDEVIEGGNFLTDRGWKESRRLGRHTLGSNVFRFFHAPCGGRIELIHDMDRMDKTFKTRTWETPPPHHLWMLKFPGDGREPAARAIEPGDCR